MTTLGPFKVAWATLEPAILLIWLEAFKICKWKRYNFQFFLVMKHKSTSNKPTNQSYHTKIYSWISKWQLNFHSELKLNLYQANQLVTLLHNIFQSRCSLSRNTDKLVSALSYKVKIFIPGAAKINLKCKLTNIIPRNWIVWLDIQ